MTYTNGKVPFPVVMRPVMRAQSRRDVLFDSRSNQCIEIREALWIFGGLLHS
jgi:hypothetical protein